MKRIIAGATIAAALLGALAPADGKSKPQPTAGNKLTEADLRLCMGVDGSGYDDQIAACTKIIKSGKVKPPHHGDYYATRGAAYFAKGDAEKALADLNTAISIRNAAEFRFERALIHMSRKALDAAKTDLAEVTKQKPAFAPAHFMRGLIAYTSADYQEALTHFSQAIEHRPTYFQAIYARGATKKKLGDEAGSKKDVAQAVGMSPKVEAEMTKLGLTL